MAIEQKKLDRSWVFRILKKQQSVAKLEDLKTLSKINIPEIFEEKNYFGTKIYQFTEIGDGLFEDFKNLRIVNV